MQCSEKGKKLAQWAKVVGPGSNIGTSDAHSMNLYPGPVQEARRPRKRCKISINLNITLAALLLAPLISDQGVRGRPTPLIMIDRHPGDSNREPMQLKNDGVPILSSVEQGTPCIHNHLRLMTITQISSSVSLSIAKLTISAEIITVLTRYRPIVVELLKTVMTVIFPGGHFFDLI